MCYLQGISTATRMESYRYTTRGRSHLRAAGGVSIAHAEDDVHADGGISLQDGMCTHLASHLQCCAYAVDGGTRPGLGVHIWGWRDITHLKHACICSSLPSPQLRHPPSPLWSPLSPVEAYRCHSAPTSGTRGLPRVEGGWRGCSASVLQIHTPHEGE